MRFAGSATATSRPITSRTVRDCARTGAAGAASAATEPISRLRRLTNGDGRKADIETLAAARPMARHREPGGPDLAAGSPPPETPRPAGSRVTTADGRSPGSRLAALRRLSGLRPSGAMTEDSPLTVAGAAADRASALLRSLLIP